VNFQGRGLGNFTNPERVCNSLRSLGNFTNPERVYRRINAARKNKNKLKSCISWQLENYFEDVLKSTVYNQFAIKNPA
jgi:hypothetical protein